MIRKGFGASMFPVDVLVRCRVVRRFVLVSRMRDGSERVSRKSMDRLVNDPCDRIFVAVFAVSNTSWTLDVAARCRLTSFVDHRTWLRWLAHDSQYTTTRPRCIGVFGKSSSLRTVSISTVQGIHITLQENGEKASDPAQAILAKLPDGPHRVQSIQCEEPWHYQQRVRYQEHRQAAEAPHSECPGMPSHLCLERSADIQKCFSCLCVPHLPPYFYSDLAHLVPDIPTGADTDDGGHGPDDV